MSVTALAPAPAPAPADDFVEPIAQALSAAALVECVAEAINDAGLSQAAAAQQIGISDATLSQWLRDKYPGDREAVAKKVSRWLDARTARAELEKRLPPAPEWVETKASRRVIGALGYAQFAADFAVVYGAAGSGKTAAARRYAATRPNVWMATITAGSRTIGPCLERVAHAIGMRHMPYRIWRSESALVDRLRNTRGLVIVDEAQHLDVRSLEALRGLHDAAEIGFALLGSEVVYARLTGGGRSAAFAQLWSRIGRRVHLGRTDPADAEAIAIAFGVEDKAARRAVRNMTNQPGALRAVVKTLRLASLLAAGASIDATHVMAAQRDLGAA